MVYFNFETVLPIHYGTFPIIDQTPESFVTGMASGPTEVLTPKPGETVELQAFASVEKISWA